jgi:hypothetical protein
MKSIQKIFSALGTLNDITVFFEDCRSTEINKIMQSIEDYYIN